MPWQAGRETACLIDLLLLARPVTFDPARPPDVLTQLTASGVVAVRHDRAEPVLRVEPLRVGDTDAWLVSDHRVDLPLPSDHVVGLGRASMTLASLVPRRSFDSVLDLGCGSGVQALLLDISVRRYVGTDVSVRALDLARVTAALNGLDLDLRQGDRYEPVAAERFDLVVSNPPLVVRPGSRHIYRDSPLDGDALCASVVRDAASHLTAHGCAVILAHWLHVDGEDWTERIARWVPPGVDAWIVQREAVSPTDYVRIWLADSGEDRLPDAAERERAWRSWFDDRRVSAVGMGWVALAAVPAGSAEDGVVRVDDARGAWPDPPGDAVDARLRGWRWLREAGDADVLSGSYVPAPGITVAAASEDRLMLVESTTGRRSVLDPLGSAVVVGLLSGDPLASALARVSGPDPAVIEGVVEAVRALVREGLLAVQDTASRASSQPPEPASSPPPV